MTFTIAQHNIACKRSHALLFIKDEIRMKYFVEIAFLRRRSGSEGYLFSKNYTSLVLFMKQSIFGFN